MTSTTSRTAPAPHRPAPIELLARAMARPRWGRVSASPGRYGVTRYRLVVLAPGSRAQDWWLLRCAEASPLAGTAAWATALVVEGSAPRASASGGLDLVVAALAGVLAALALHGLGRRARRSARVLLALTGVPDRSGRLAAEADELRGLARMLREAAAAERRGAVQPLEFETIWAAAWERMPPRPARATRGAPQH